MLDVSTGHRIARAWADCTIVIRYRPGNLHLISPCTVKWVFDFAVHCETGVGFRRALRNPMQQNTISIQFVPGVRVLAIEFRRTACYTANSNTRNRIPADLAVRDEDEMHSKVGPHRPVHLYSAESKPITHGFGTICTETADSLHCCHRAGARIEWRFTWSFLADLIAFCERCFSRAERRELLPCRLPRGGTQPGHTLCQYRTLHSEGVGRYPMSVPDNA
eukprot:1253649-Rhodomonas_salina.1